MNWLKYIIVIVGAYFVFYLVKHFYEIFKNSQKSKKLNNSNRLSIVVDRDPVHAGDDCEHKLIIEYEESVTVKELIDSILLKIKLPKIDGGKATWLILLGENTNNIISVVAQQWSEPKFIRDEYSIFVDILMDEKTNIYFQYMCQVDPLLVVDSIKLGHDLPNKYSS